MTILITTLTDFFMNHHYLAYLILFFGSYLETIVGISFIVYGEVFFLSGAILAGAGILNIWIVGTACICGGILGDSTSYWMGRKFGHKLVGIVFKKENKHLNPTLYKKGKKFLHKRGKKSIFFSRFIGPLPGFTPFIAGTIKIKYKDFIKYNWPGVVLGIGQFILIGYIFGVSYVTILPILQRNMYYLMLLAILPLVGFYVIYKLNKIRKKSCK